METILSNHYLFSYLLSFMGISSTIYLIRTSHIYYKIIIRISRCQALQKCKPKYTINCICQYRYGNINILEWFLMTNQINPDIDTILIKSAKYGNLDIVYYMVKQVGDIHVNDNETLRSAFYGHFEVVQCLFLRSKNKHSTRR
jgi:hypothetical protein